MNKELQQDDDLRKYRKFGLTLLQLMAALFVLGIVATVVWWLI